MSKADLEQIFYINKEIKMWNAELQKAASKNDNERIKTLIAELSEKLERSKSAAIAQISAIPNSLTRQVVYYRCIKLMKWQRVASEVGGGNTAESVRKIYSRYMKSQ